MLLLLLLEALLLVVAVLGHWWRWLERERERVGVREVGGGWVLRRVERGQVEFWGDICLGEFFVEICMGNGCIAIHGGISWETSWSNPFRRFFGFGVLIESDFVHPDHQTRVNGWSHLTSI